MFNGFGMAFPGRFCKASALMDADGDVQPCRLLQEVELANYASVMDSGCMSGPLVSLCSSMVVTAGVDLGLEPGCKCRSLMMESISWGCDKWIEPSACFWIWIPKKSPMSPWSSTVNCWEQEHKSITTWSMARALGPNTMQLSMYTKKRMVP